MKSGKLKIINVMIHPGETITLALPTPQIYTCAPMYIPIHVIHGKKRGPTLLVCGAMHGDEVNGVAITQKLLKLRLLSSLRGTLIVIPQMNIYGMMTLSRTLPDRRDLDGSFPGSDKGSFAARLASVLHREIFCHVDYCIDLHTGEPNIRKLPQVRTRFHHKESMVLAEQFASPVILDAPTSPGLLYLMDQERSIPTIYYEAGEALRLDEQAIRLGVQGIVRVMRHCDMLPPGQKEGKKLHACHVKEAHWVRSSSSGLCELFFRVGKRVKKGERVARIFDPFGTEQKEEVFAPEAGMIIAQNHLPILNEGEPICHIAEMNLSDMSEIEAWSIREGASEGFFE